VTRSGKEENKLLLLLKEISFLETFHQVFNLVFIMDVSGSKITTP
jgi:hypothetical protein